MRVQRNRSARFSSLSCCSCRSTRKVKSYKIKEMFIQIGTPRRMIYRDFKKRDKPHQEEDGIANITKRI